jgi:hypothetical protein
MATNYLFNINYFHNQHDYRLLLLEALIPNWNKNVFWNEQTLGETAKLKKQKWEKDRAKIFKLSGISAAASENRTVLEKFKGWFS